MLGDHQIEVGQELRFASPHGPVTGKVLTIEPDKFMVDFNHPLAGKTLLFKIKVMGITDHPTQQTSCSCSSSSCDIRLPAAPVAVDKNQRRGTGLMPPPSALMVKKVGAVREPPRRILPPQSAFPEKGGHLALLAGRRGVGLGIGLIQTGRRAGSLHPLALLSVGVTGAGQFWLP